MTNEGRNLVGVTAEGVLLLVSLKGKPSAC